MLDAVIGVVFIVAGCTLAYYNRTIAERVALANKVATGHFGSPGWVTYNRIVAVVIGTFFAVVGAVMALGLGSTQT